MRVMQLTYVLELMKPTKRKEEILLENVSNVANNRRLVANELKKGITKLSSSDFKSCEIPSAVKNQNIREVKALFKLFQKANSKKEGLEFKDNQPICFNNQNFEIDGHMISFPLFHKKVQRFTFPVLRTGRLNELLHHLNVGAKKGKASLFFKNNKWFFAITVKIEVENSTNKNVMGVDIGLRQLAVASVSSASGKELNRSFYNGKEVGFIRKKYRSTRRKLGKLKLPKLIKRLSNKEQRWMTNKNHEISRQLINLAVQEQVGVLVMESLKNIRKAAYSLNRSDRSIHSWAFFELQKFIEYKAKLAGIEVVYVDPKYTSQQCSKCGIVCKKQRNKNNYSCSCGNNLHADLNASRNIVQKYLTTKSTKKSA